MSHARESITTEVLDVIQSVRGKSVKKPLLTMHMRVVEDLHLQQDAGDIVLILQKRTGIKPPQKDWENARTIGDIIDLLLKYGPADSV